MLYNISAHAREIANLNQSNKKNDYYHLRGAIELKITVTPDDDMLRRFQNMLGAVSDGEARTVMVRAINRTTDSAYSRATRAISKQSGIPLKIVRAQTRKIKPTTNGNGPIIGIIEARGKPVALKYFQAKQFKAGVKAKIFGEWKMFKGFFMNAGTYNSGQLLKGGHVYARSTKASYPIKTQTGPAVPDELVRDESLRQFQQTVATMLPARLSHELNRILNP